MLLRCTLMCRVESPRYLIHQSFGYGFAFALGMALVRFFFAKGTQGSTWLTNLSGVSSCRDGIY
jgi:hypothetical protein